VGVEVVKELVEVGIESRGGVLLAGSDGVEGNSNGRVDGLGLEK
jgi:hypothetical protein